ncbi:hypothetical protein D9M73_111520 [compost metagenome]
MDLAVVAGAGREIVTGDAVDGVERHRLGRRVEDRRFVHIVPETGDAVLKEPLVQCAPPRPRLGLREVGEDRRAGPDRRDIIGAIGVFDEFVAAFAARIRRIASLDLGDMQIGDRDQLDSLRLHVGGQFGQIGEGCGVGGEGPVAVLIVDVHPDHVGRHAIRAQMARDLADLVGGHVAVARLLIAKRPFRGERGMTGEIGIAPRDLGQAGTGDEIIIDRPIGATKGQRIGIAVAEIEPGAIGIVEQDAVTAARRAGREEERNRFVDRVVGAGETERVGVPVDKFFAAPVEPAGLVAKAVEMLGDRQAFAQRKALAVDRDGCGIGGYDLAVARFEGDCAARTDADAQAGGGEAVCGCRYRGARLALLGQHRPTGVFGIGTVARDADAHHAVGERDQAHFERTRRHLDPIALRG